MLSSCGIFGSGTKHLKKVFWTNLQVLCLKSNSIDNVGASYLSKCNFEQLRELNLDGNILTNHSMKSLVKATWNNL